MTSGRIEETFARLKQEGRAGFIAFLTVGYPNVDATMQLVPALVEGGADLIELGIPFSDPLADGPTIQKSNFAALQQGVTIDTCLDVARKLRERGLEAPLIPMGYYNPIMSYGIERFTKDAAAAGIDGLIVVDLPPEESDEFLAACKATGLRLIYLVAPTSTEERIREVAKRASGFVYCVAVTGVTSARDQLPPYLAEFVGRVRNLTNLPIAVGFGISQPEHFRAVARIADAAVIGSAIVDEIAKSEPSNLAERLKSYAEVVTGRRGAAA